MSSKYRKKLKKQKQQQDSKKMEITFKDEWSAMIYLVDHDVDVEYGGEIYIPHDHLSPGAIAAVDFLVSLDYIPMDIKDRPLGPVATDYLKDKESHS